MRTREACPIKSIVDRIYRTYLGWLGKTIISVAVAARVDDHEEGILSARAIQIQFQRMKEGFFNIPIVLSSTMRELS